MNDKTILGPWTAARTDAPQPKRVLDMTQRIDREAIIRSALKEVGERHSMDLSYFLKGHTLDYLRNNYLLPLLASKLIVMEEPHMLDRMTAINGFASALEKPVSKPIAEEIIAAIDTAVERELSNREVRQPRQIG